jgi:hypothetical protein
VRRGSGDLDQAGSFGRADGQRVQGHLDVHRRHLLSQQEEPDQGRDPVASRQSTGHPGQVAACESGLAELADQLVHTGHGVVDLLAAGAYPPAVGLQDRGAVPGIHRCIFAHPCGVAGRGARSARPHSGPGSATMGVMRRSHDDQPLLITTAPESSDVEFDRRRHRYLFMMGGRVVCVLGAVAVYHVSILLALALVIGGAALPWCAVIIANDGPPRKRGRMVAHGTGSGDPALPGASERTVDG